MQCPYCGYNRKASDTNPDWQCPLCNVVYEKVRCCLLWVLELTAHSKIPENISKAYIITAENKLYSFNKTRKNALIEIQLKSDEFNRLINALEITLPSQLDSQEIIELIDMMGFDKLNVIYTLTGNRIFDSCDSTQGNDSTNQEKEEKMSSYPTKDELIENSPVKKLPSMSLINKITPLHNKKEPICQQCGGEMVKSKHSYGNFVGIFGALIIFLVGLCIMIVFIWTSVGAIIGLLLMIMSLGMGGKREKVWKCITCGYYFKRL